MEFKDIENIHKDVIVRVKDILNLKELLPYMEAYFTPMTIQGIRADMNNHGPSYATTNHLFDSVKRKPPSFYRMLAALRHIGQDDVYEIYQKSLRKYFKNDQDKLGRVLSLIEAQFEELERNPDHGHHDGDDGDDGGGRRGGGGVQVMTSGKGASGSGNQACGGSESDWDSNTKDRSSLSHSDKDNYYPPPLSSSSAAAAAAAAAANRTAAPRSPVTGGRTSPDNYHLNSSTNLAPSQLDPRYEGAPLSSLQAGVYKQLGLALEACGRSGKPWWDHLIINGDLEISRKEQKRIGNEENPGIELLDVLDTREYTLKKLEDLFLRCNVDEPLNILRQFGNRVIVDKQHVTENNLNMNISKKQDNEKDMNFGSKSELKQNNEDGGSSNYSHTDISGPASFTNNESSLSLDGDDIKGTQAIQPCGERDTENTAQELGRNSSNESPILNQDFISVVLKPNKDSSDDHEECESRGNESPKGTRAVKVHEDPTGEQAQHEPGREAMKLQYDRIHQFDADPEALEQTSFISVRQSNNDSSSTCEQAVNDQVTALSLQDCTQNEVNAGQRFGNNISELSICQDSLDLPESGENQRTMSDERDGNIPNNLDSLNTNSNASFEN